MPIKQRVQPRNTVGSRIQALRERKNMSASDLARAVSVTPTAVWNWENDNTTPRHLALVNIANALGVSVDYLLDGTGTEPSSGTAPGGKSIDFAATIEATRRDLARKLDLPLERVKIVVEFN